MLGTERLKLLIGMLLGAVSLQAEILAANIKQAFNSLATGFAKSIVVAPETAGQGKRVECRRKSCPPCTGW